MDINYDYDFLRRNLQLLNKVSIVICKYSVTLKPLSIRGNTLKSISDLHSYLNSECIKGNNCE